MSDANGGRYRLSDPDLLRYIKGLETRIAKLERTPQTNNAGINTAGIVVKGGAIFVRRDDESVQGLIALGSDNFVNGENGMALVIERSQSVDSGVDDGSGGTIKGLTSVFLTTVDGTGADPSTGFPTITLSDKTGDTIFADTTLARRGISHPQLSYPWYSPTFFATTSGTAADVALVEWVLYHPHLQFNIQCQNDVGTTGEIQVTSLNDGAVKTIFATTSGENDFTFFHIKRSAMSSPDSNNGNSEILTVQFRRSGGAGTARFRFTSIVGLDRSDIDGDF